MGTRIHPQNGEPFCPSCHADADEPCTDEHEAWCDDNGTEYLGQLQAALAYAARWKALAKRYRRRYLDDNAYLVNEREAVTAERDQLRADLALEKRSVAFLIEDRDKYRAEVERWKVNYDTACVEVERLRGQLEDRRRLSDHYKARDEEARTDNERLRAELETVTKRMDATDDDIERCWYATGLTRAGSLIDAITALRAALRRYGQHEGDCAVHPIGYAPEQPCDCGLDAALGEGE